jgi:Spy/CpxP family protein refolding chaperone
MGLARPAELNRYPGPRHVLDLADSLDLSADQRATVQRIFDDMQARAKALGREIVDAEAALDEAFAEGAIPEDTLAASVRRIAGLQGELRTVHLRAHLSTREVLTERQVREYDRLRGYAAVHDHSPDAGAGGSG